MGKNIPYTTILLAPLDWGLGHAARCIVLLRYLEQAGCKIVLACNPVQKAMLIQEFPKIEYVSLQGYNVNYHENKRQMVWKILQQLPKIFIAVRKENKWLQKIIDDYKIDLVISDNRYGLYTKKCFCVFITHQLRIKAPYKWVEKFMQRINYHYIGKFNSCWVPDIKDAMNLAGELSHPEKLPQIPVTYIGALSRFSFAQAKEKKYTYAVIISGPEPQRSMLEKKVLTAAENIPEKFFIARGKPASNESIHAPANCTVANHLDTKNLEALIAESEFIISRSGYTTIMELIPAGIKTIMIPTPGQTEQEYLAQYLMKRKLVYSFKQDEDFIFHLQQAAAFEYEFPNVQYVLLKETLDNFFNKQ